MHATLEGEERGYSDYRSLLEEERLDAAVVAAPTRLHGEIGLACVDRGVSLLVEKPLAASVADGERLRDAARGAGVLLTVGQVERFNPSVVALKQRLEAGEGGRVVQVRARRVGPFLKRGRDVGVVHDLATHDIDVFRFLLGLEVERVQAETQSGLRTEYEDTIAGVLRFQGGVLGLLEANWLTQVKLRELAVLCEEALFTVDYITQELRTYRTAVVPPTVETLPGAGEAPLRMELEAFVRAVHGEESPTVSADDGLAAMRVADALVEASRRGEVVLLAAGRPA
jgi:predicted dehydrogenase